MQLSRTIPANVEVLLCDNLSPDFLIGRKALSRWNLSVNYYNNNQESWHAGDHRVMAMSAREAAEYNAGFFSVERSASREWHRVKSGERMIPPLLTPPPPTGTFPAPPDSNVCRPSDPPGAPPFLRTYPLNQVNSRSLNPESRPTSPCGCRPRQVKPTGTFCSGLSTPWSSLLVRSVRYR
jgi:hypothetical protein